MKLSQLIDQAEEWMAKYGDIDVKVFYDECEYVDAWKLGSRN